MVAGFLQLALTNAAVATVLAGVVWLIGRRFQRPQWMYGLWLLVLLKLVAPPVHSFSIHVGRTESASNQSNGNFDEGANQWVRAASVLDEPAEASAGELDTTRNIIAGLPPASLTAIDLLPFESQVVGSTTAESRLGAASSRDDSTETTHLHPLSAIRLVWQKSRAWVVATIASAWLAGSLCWIALVTHRNWRFSRLIRQADHAPAWLQREACILARRWDLRRLPELLTVEARLSPFLWATPSRACVVLPAPLLRAASRSQIVSLLTHELAHYRRGDHYCRWFELLVLSLYWWNPIAWWARRQLHRAEEECCDAWVLWAFPEHSRAYAGAILATLDFLSGSQPVMPAFASGLGAADVMERRLTMILRGPLPRRLSFRSQLGLLLVALVVLPLSARAQQPSTSEPSPVLAPVAGDRFAGQSLGGSQVTAPSADPTPGLADAAPGTTTPTATAAAVGQPIAGIRPGDAANAAPALAPPVADSPYPGASHDRSIEARMDRLEKLVSDIAAAVGRGGASTVQGYDQVRSDIFAAQPDVATATTFRSNSLGDLKKHRVDLEVQVDAMREQIERLEQDMKKLDEAIAIQEEKKRSIEGVIERGQLQRQ